MLQDNELATPQLLCIDIFRSPTSERNLNGDKVSNSSIHIDIDQAEHHPDAMFSSANISEIPENTVMVNRSTMYSVIAIFAFLVGFMAAWLIVTVSGNNSASVDVIRVAVQQAIATALVAGPAQANANTANRQVPTIDPGKRSIVSVANSPIFGPDTAPVTVIEFGDFQCPFCEQFFLQTETALVQKYQGKIRFVYRNFPLSDIHPYAQGSAEAAQCAYEQKRFWEYHNLLYQNQAQLGQADLYVNYARQLNLDVTSFTVCLNSGKYAYKVQNDYAEGLLLGVSGTPTFFINGRILVGAQPLSAFSAYINAELATITPDVVATMVPSQ